MIAFVSGVLEQVDENAAVVDVGGVGYRVFMSGTGLSHLPQCGSKVKIHTYLKVAEDAMDLYGFNTAEELSMFKLMISVSGVGPKAALAILTVLSPAEFALAVVTEDYKAIARAQGVGPKLAQRVSLELRDKLKNTALLPQTGESKALPAMAASSGNDALEALLVLGYSRAEAVEAIAKVNTDGLTLEETIKAALAQLLR